jgi:UDP-glucose 4-epimerase
MVLPSPDLEGLIKTFQPDYCIHCAGSASVGYSMQNPGVDFNSGPPVVFHLLDSIRKVESGCKTIFLSSAAVYGNPNQLPILEDSSLNPVSPYGYHKSMCEDLMKEFHTIYGLDHVILRIFSCYGTGLRKQLLWDVCNKFKKGEAVFFGTGQETRDFIHVKDLASLIALIIKNGIVNKTINVGSGLETRIADVVALLAKSLNYSKNNISFNGDTKLGDPLKWKAEVSKISDLGFRPSISLKEGIQQYADWFHSIGSKR